MNPEVKVKLLAALRSGKYKQGRYALRSPRGRFCCLGVLADVKGVTWDDNDKSELSLKPLFEGKDVRHDIGSAYNNYLNEMFAEMPLDKQKEYTGMNDTGVPFSKIADSMEKDVTL